MGGCGAHCRCGSTALKTQEAVCAMPNKEGVCPCGKTKENCCHKDKFRKEENEAVYELCKKHGLRHLCE